MDVLDVTLTVSILLRLAGVALSLVLLYRVRDRRFAFLTMLLSLMALRQLFQFFDSASEFSELPGLLVSVLALVVLYYLLGYVRQEQAIKSELTKANETLRESRNRLEAIVSASPEDVLLFDAEGQCLEVISGNKADVTGALVGRSIDEFRPPEVADSVREAIETTLRTGAIERVEYSLDQEGETRWYDVRTARLDGADEDGGSDGEKAADGSDRSPRVLFSRRDVTDRKERERDLRRFRRAVDAAGAAVYITDREEEIVYVNPAFEDITGYDASEAQGRTPRILSSGEHDDQYYQRLWATIGSGRTWREEVVNRRKSGERYHANQTIAPIFDADGEVIEFVAIQIDITDRKLRERQLSVLDRVLRHNLRNDMGVILGHAANIEAETGGDLRASASLIQRTGRSLLEKATKEREIVHLITEKPLPRPLDVRSMIDEQVGTARSRWSAATIEVDGPETITAVALPDLEDAIGEVISNAIEHGDEEPDIEIDLTADTESVTIRIADDGPGIPEQDRRILTDDHDIDALYHGSGIGLWYVYWVVKLSGGRLDFEENEPRGSIVVIELDRGR